MEGNGWEEVEDAVKCFFLLHVIKTKRKGKEEARKRGVNEMWSRGGGGVRRQVDLICGQGSGNVLGLKIGECVM